MDNAKWPHPNTQLLIPDAAAWLFALMHSHKHARWEDMQAAFDLGVIINLRYLAQTHQFSN